MKDFTLTVFSLCFVIGAFSFVLKDNRLFETVKRCFFILLFALVLPYSLYALAYIREVPDFSVLPTSSSLSEVTGEAMEVGIKSAICESFSLDEDDLRVVLRGFSPETMKAEGVTVFLSGSSRFSDFFAIQSFVEEQNLCPCEVVYE